MFIGFLIVAENHLILVWSLQTHSIKLKTMGGSLLYVVAVILIIGWLLGFFVFNAGSIIHVLLVIAVIAIILRLIRGQNPV